jgi:nucleoside-diphosphate-sugar epimerase
LRNKIQHKEEIEKMRALITGAAGSCGGDVAPILAKYYNYDIITTDIRKPDNDFPYVPCDIKNLEEVDQALKGRDIDAIIHLGTLQPGLGPADMSIDINVKGVCNILESAKNNGVKRVVFTSSVWAASRGPNSPYQPIDEDIKPSFEDMYDITKHMGEELCAYYHKMFGLNATAFRFCGYHPVEGFSDKGDILWDKIDLKALVGRYCGMGPAFKLTNAWDLTQAFRMAIENKDFTHGLYLIGVGIPFTSDEAEALKKTPLAIYEKYYPGVTEFFKEIGFDMPAISFWYNTQKAKEQLGFSPRFTLQDIMNQYYESKKSK